MMINSNKRSNHNSKVNQERELICVRKSFSIAKPSITGQPRSLIPNTPDNSPAEFARRCSFGKEGGFLLQDHEKENERDRNLEPISRVRSPSVPKMTKNFMSPTISAVSKINPSPRKKVLGERNEAIRTSASLSEGKFHFYSTSSLDFSDENEPKEDIIETLPCPTFLHMNKEPEKEVTDFSLEVEKIELEPDLVVLSPDIPKNDAISYETKPQECDIFNVVLENNVGLNSKVNACSSPSTTLAPLDADPSLPPYDPKTNFLSPRPQFLRYKPNPKIESYINQGISLEDEFSSESFSETEEVQSEETSSVRTSLEEKSSFSEPSSPKIQQLEESVEHKIEPRPWFGGMWRGLCLISFVILFGFVAMYKGDFTEEKINGLLANLSFKPREVKFSPLPFDNLTAWLELEVEDFLFRDSMLMLEDFDPSSQNYGEEIESKSLNDYDYEENDHTEEFERQKVEDNFVADDYVIEQATSFSEDENQEAKFGVTTEVQDEIQCDFKVEDQSLTSLPQEYEVQPQVTTENDLASEVQGHSSEQSIEAKDHSLSTSTQISEEVHQVTTENDPIIEVQDEFPLNSDSKDQSLSTSPKTPEEPQVTIPNDLITSVSEISTPILEATTYERSLTSIIATSILFVLTLLTAIAFLYMKKSRKSTPIIDSENSTCFVETSKTEPDFHENRSSMMSEACPSEMSSVQKTSSNNSKGSNNEAQSVEKSTKRNYKRESLASSSSEYTMSASYGSFTTYSKMPSKQRDDEVVTPVRRSSRIRSKITSP